MRHDRPIRIGLLLLALILLPVGRSRADDPAVAAQPPNAHIGAGPNQLTPEELADGWILLFDGETTFGWQANSQGQLARRRRRVSVSEGEPGLLNTTSPFADFSLKFEFRRQEKTNSGVFLRTAAEPTDPTGRLL